MSIVDLFSKRQKRSRGEVPDVYRYDHLSQNLRVQIVHIWSDAIGVSDSISDAPYRLFESVNEVLCREYGVFSLRKGNAYRHAPIDFFLECDDVQRCLDVVELVFSEMDTKVRESPQWFRQTKQSPDDAIAELNQRFKEHGIGYEYRSGQIIRIDSEPMHREVMIPALTLLQQPFLKGANAEFRSAHEHYRHQHFKECLVDCLKAFESTMKAICDKRKWKYPPNSTAKHLIECCITNGLFPSFLESHLSALRATLESGLPTTRNRLAAHGQGAIPIDVPEEVASYALHLTATNILLFASSAARLK